MNAKALIKLVEANDWYFVRQKGSHMIFKHKTINANVSIPVHGSADIAEGTLRQILKKAKIKR
jgi:predicted RNA binding protein YcfA (HicA-like mRNA interferase family)